MSQDIEGKLNVDWDSYWQGFMSLPMLESFRFALVKGAYQRLLKNISFPAASCFCELGAGTGSMSRYWGISYEADITLVDNNSKALELSRDVFAGYPHAFKQLDCDVLDVQKAGVFDLVHSGGLIEHFVGEAREKIIDVHVSLVKEGGYLLILVPVRNMWYRILNEGIINAFGLLKHIPEEPWSYQELEKSLSRHGFEIISRTTVINELGILARKPNVS